MGGATTAPANGDSRTPPTVPAACLGCRAKHLKCDGLNPCSRCLASGDTVCQYVASRRGYKGPRRNTAQNPNKRHASDSPSSGGETCPMLLGATLPTTSMATTMTTPVTPSLATFNPMGMFESAAASPFASGPLGGMQLYRNPYLNPMNGALVEVTANRPPQTIPERCIDSFYSHFYAGHPAVLPKEHLLKMAKDRNLDHLFAAMRWAGSLYFEVGPLRATFFDEAMRLCYDEDTPKDGFLVQALVILIICLDGCAENEKARDILSDVERIAIEIGLYQRPYATLHGRSNPTLEESWRRTWWDLFVVDGMVAGVHRATNFLLFDIVADVGLPCEEFEYTSGQIPRPMYLEDFEDQIFTGNDRPFSSFAYRIASIRNLGRMMRLPESVFPGDDNVDRIESLLSNWRLHLPESKRDCLNKDCQLDEMMFQAHMINHACSIILHQPHSQLDSSPARDVTACAPHQAVQSGEHFNAHTRHIITAASAISKMVTYNVPITCHTHFFTCVLTLSSVVHLSKWALIIVQNDADLKEKIRLNIGALNKLSNVWKAAGRAGSQVKGVASEIYHVKKAQQNNSSLWVGYTQEEIISSMASDESIMSDINSMLN
ncbi:N-terminal binuclear Zn cluster-containing/DNA binding domain-containing protein [Pseudomassariella vexata]|uniref:N-terminal binuclear Zn cluster-containing/DNA binding domain-containing protein n=1 Tax=Pseudomassariella vexata TaxID=1141098 RepID=A0A1Y2DJ37_9PEZI|nr:N-terminal binuclear Zn cluster-containing/DNA binding domain-containing protein [Pseudomassariella vexata]ORY59247.1 N-terminal binuclear Zn cluster-containing/DNA binding domain-containing protein [Pseudomassariella vexata]